MVDYIRYLNQGATRNQPLSPELVNALGYLQKMGITADVFSGGQPEIGTSNRRTGSVRHDDGNAGDMFFNQNGRRLDWANPADVPIFQDIVRQGKAAGITGFGAGPGYMQEGSMHVGYGNPAVWGAGGAKRNAPQWLVDAYGGQTSKPMPSYDDMVASGTSAAVPGAPQAGDPTNNLLAAAPKGLTMGAPQGNVPAVNGVMPPLDRAPDIPAAAAAAPQVAAATPAAAGMTLGNKIGDAIFGDDMAAQLKGMFGPNSDPKGTGNQALSLIKGTFGGGQTATQQANQEAANIQPSGLMNDGTDAARTQAATQLMATLLAKKRGMTMGMA